MADPRGVDILNKVNEIPFNRGKVVSIEDAIRRKQEAAHAQQLYGADKTPQAVNGYGGALGTAQTQETQETANAAADSCKDAGTAILGLRLQHLHAQLNSHVEQWVYHRAQAEAVKEVINLLKAHPELETLIDAMRAGIV